MGGNMGAILRLTAIVLLTQAAACASVVGAVVGGFVKKTEPLPEDPHTEAPAYWLAMRRPVVVHDRSDNDVAGELQGVSLEGLRLRDDDEVALIPLTNVTSVSLV